MKYKIISFYFSTSRNQNLSHKKHNENLTFVKKNIFLIFRLNVPDLNNIPIPNNIMILIGRG